jgi:tRNA(Ile2)-agmatinylcytidine synthase
MLRIFDFQPAVIVNCAAFEPTGKFREITARLLPGDDVTVYGALKQHNANRHPTLNLEKIRIHRLVEKLFMRNPICPNCGKHMKSAGRTQGFRCERCSHLQLTSKKMVVKEERKIQLGIFIPAPKAHRHLTKPIARYGLERVWNEESPRGDWHSP